MSDNKCVDMKLSDEEIKNDKVYYNVGAISKTLMAINNESKARFLNYDQEWPSSQFYAVSLSHEIYCFGGINGGVVFSSFNGFSWSKVILLIKYNDTCQVMGCELIDGKVYLIFYRVESKKLCCITYYEHLDLQEEIIISHDVGMELTNYPADTLLHNGAIYVFYLKDNHKVFFRCSRDNFKIEYSIQRDNIEQNIIGNMLSVCKVEGVAGFYLLLMGYLYHFSRRGIVNITRVKSNGRLSSRDPLKLDVSTENEVITYKLKDDGTMSEEYFEYSSGLPFGLFDCLIV